ncbi:hypothetical protein P4E94_18010 [Pontiellaceae bacterium B12219]|nr:hypothetical protein [Pontiellaceae bacterium B12219]
MKSPREVITGKSSGINMAAAIEDAVGKASPPSQGFDNQTYVIAGQKIEHGGFVPTFTSIVEIHVFDGKLNNL